MPGNPATSPNFAAPRYSDADNADFAGQVNAVTDAFDAAAAKRGSIVDADIAAANKDGAAGVPSLRTLGVGAQQALPGSALLANPVVIGQLAVSGAIAMNGAAAVINFGGENNPSNSIIAANAMGDMAARFMINAAGQMNWGPGNAGTDTYLQRNGVNSLQTSGSLAVGGTFTPGVFGGGSQTAQRLGVSPTWTDTIMSSGSWGSNRSNAGVSLRIDTPHLLTFSWASPNLIFTVDGAVSASITLSSDAAFKTNVRPIATALDKLQRLRGVLFDWDDDAGVLVGHDHHGVIAQEVREVLPDAVIEHGGDFEDGDGNIVHEREHLSVNDRPLVALLIEAVKEIAGKVEKLEAASAA